MADYHASKFAAVGFNESVRLEMRYLGKNVTCTTVCPFFINTGMFTGVKTGIIFPLLQQNAVVDRIINAILQSEGEVCIPWTMGVMTHILKGLFSPALNDILVNLTVG